MCKQVAEDIAHSFRIDRRDKPSIFLLFLERRDVSILLPNSPDDSPFLRFWKYLIVSAVVLRWIARFSSR